MKSEYTDLPGISIDIDLINKDTRYIQLEKYLKNKCEVIGAAMVIAAMIGINFRNKKENPNMIPIKELERLTRIGIADFLIKNDLAIHSITPTHIIVSSDYADAIGVSNARNN